MKKRSKIILILCLCLCVAVASTAIGYWQYEEHHERDQRLVTVEKGVLYRARQPDPLRLNRLRSRGITQVINFRPREEDPKVFDAEQRDCRENGVSFVNIPIDTAVPSDAQLEQSLRLIVTHKGATLIHCAQGRKRTGLVAAAYRIIYQGWAAERALAEMRKYFDDSSSKHEKARKLKWLRQVHRDRAQWLVRVPARHTSVSSGPAVSGK